jgi:flagellar hook-length control protein FliK
MSMEVTNKAPANETPKASEADAKKKNASGTGKANEGVASFLSILGSLDDGSSALLPEEVDGLLMADQRASKLKPLDGDGVVDPALLLAQAKSLGNSAETPDSGAKPAGKARPQHLVGVNALTGLGASVTGAAQETGKTGKSAADDLAGGKFALDEALVGSNQKNGGSAQESAKEVLSEKVVKFIQELAASLAKPVDASPAPAGGARDAVREAAPQDVKMSSEDSIVNTTTQQGANGAMGVDGVVATAEGSGTDGDFSEQVSYWVGQDVQKAEMTLDGLGLSPVEVSISMQGNEAQVVFRSDESQTRDMLSNAREQLQEALSRQGVALAGVSVGTSHSGGGQQHNSGGGQRSGWKVAAVEVAEVAPSGTAGRTQSSGRAVDLFV